MKEKGKRERENRKRGIERGIRERGNGLGEWIEREIEKKKCESGKRVRVWGKRDRGEEETQRGRKETQM